jgi:hypothetical protein
VLCMKRGARCVRCSCTPVNACLAISRHTVHFEFRPSYWAAIGSKLHLSWSLEPGCVPSEAAHCITDIDISLAPTPLSDNSPCVSQAPCVSMTPHLCLLRVRKQMLTVKWYENLFWTVNKRSGPPAEGQKYKNVASASKLRTATVLRNERMQVYKQCCRGAASSCSRSIASPIARRK